MHTFFGVLDNCDAYLVFYATKPHTLKPFLIMQVGKDQNAQAFLGTLDNDPTIGGMVDATSYYELEAEEYGRKGVNLTPELWLVKLMVGAVDPSYDEQD